MGSRPRSEARGKRKKKKKREKKSRRHQSSSSSSSPSSSSLISSAAETTSSSDESKHARKEKRKRGFSSLEHERSRLEHKKRRRGAQARTDKRHSHRRSSLKRARYSSQPDAISGLPSPQEVASTMLIKYPDLAGDLKQLLKMLDDGQAVDLSGLANEHVAAYLKQLFQSLQLQKSAHGLYFLPDGASQKTLDVLSLVISSPEKINSSVHEGQEEEKIGISKDSEQLVNEDGLNDQYGPVEKPRRVLGPALPSAEILEAAAKMTEAGPTLREVDEDISVEPFVGPPPPAAVKEAESANEAERFEEVERILSPDIENAYELLGLRVGASAELLKKRYWKLSLLVHPDKCGHPHAHQAFTVLNQAFKDLQDPIKRAKLDELIQEKETRREFEAELKAKREAAEWRRIKGVSLAGDDELLAPPKAMVRDEWMTQLPPERKPGAATQQATFFSKHSKSGRGDTSAWTDTPMDRLRKANAMFLEGERQYFVNEERDIFNKEEKDEVTAGIIDEFNHAKRGMSLLEKHQTERSKKVARASTKHEVQQPPEWVGSHPWRPWDREKDLTAGRQKVDFDKSNMAEGLSSRFSSSHRERSFL